MARILICEPVEETRELLERLVRRMGHDIVSLDELRTVDVLLFEPESRAGLALAKLLLEVRPEASLVACSAQPPRTQLTLPRLVASLLQPFSPADLARVLDGCSTQPVAPV
jgi:hypothetical protein